MCVKSCCLCCVFVCVLRCSCLVLRCSCLYCEYLVHCFLIKQVLRAGSSVLKSMLGVCWCCVSLCFVFFVLSIVFCCMVCFTTQWFSMVCV